MITWGACSLLLRSFLSSEMGLPPKKASARTSTWRANRLNSSLICRGHPYFAEADGRVRRCVFQQDLQQGLHQTLAAEAGCWLLQGAVLSTSSIEDLHPLTDAGAKSCSES